MGNYNGVSNQPKAESLAKVSANIQTDSFLERKEKGAIKLILKNKSLFINLLVMVVNWTAVSFCYYMVGF